MAGADNRLLSAFAPQHAVPAIGDLVSRRVLLPDAGTSRWRLLVGLLAATIVGVPLGLVIGVSTAAERGTRPVFQFLRMTSPLSWAPVAAGLFGIGDEPVFFLVAAAALWPIVLTTAAGVRAVDPGLILVARPLGARRARSWAASSCRQCTPRC